MNFLKRELLTSLFYLGIIGSMGLQGCQLPADSQEPKHVGLKQNDPATSAPAPSPVLSPEPTAGETQPTFEPVSQVSSTPQATSSPHGDPIVTMPSPAPSFSPDEATARIEVKLTHSEDLRILKNQILEKGLIVPVGSILSIPSSGEAIQAKIRDENGQAVFTSNSYYGLTRIEQVPTGSGITPTQLAQLNQTLGGLYVSSRIEGDLPKEVIPALALKDVGAFYSEFYEISGRPKFSFAGLLKKTFGKALNQAVSVDSQSAAEREKWANIMKALVTFSDRTRLSEGRLFYMSQKDADIASVKYENTGFVTLGGAYMIAVNSTAVRHGFAGVPCAEFVSEVLRQVYIMAGFRHQEDFSTARGNPLIWSHTALVANLGKALVKAGWVPWDHHLYQAPIGAVMGNDIADSPGHAYLNAGQNGRWILDNSGGPKGRDIAQMTKKTLQNQYHTGVFFLPPGVNPRAW